MSRHQLVEAVLCLYLLPTRAWELLAGGLVANLPTFSKDGALRLSVVGSALVALSAVTISVIRRTFPDGLPRFRFSERRP